jgi:hypothetical protein
MSMLEAPLLAQIMCDQQLACNAYDIMIKIAYAAIVTATIVAVIAFVRRRISNRSLR